MNHLLTSPALWALRVVWLVLPIVVGPAVADAFDGRSRSVQIVSAALAWGLWAMGLLATLVPTTVTLTVVRLLAPGAAVLGVWAGVAVDDATAGVLAVAGGVVVALGALAGPGVADAFVDGSSYGDERRVALRIPIPVLVGPVALSWTVAAAGVVTGPLLLASEQWVSGAVAVVVGAGAVYLVAIRFHQLSRRWLVFVPAGVVVHDPLILSDPVLLPRGNLERFGPATRGTDALDATGGAAGLVLELRTVDPFKLGVRHGRDVEEQEKVTALLVCPTRPGQTLETAKQASLPVT